MCKVINMIGDKKTLIIVDRECHLVEGDTGFDVYKEDVASFKRWVSCEQCGNDKFELSHGHYQLISRCSECHYTKTEYDG